MCPLNVRIEISPYSNILIRIILGGYWIYCRSGLFTFPIGSFTFPKSIGQKILRGKRCNNSTILFNRSPTKSFLDFEYMYALQSKHELE